MRWNSFGDRIFVKKKQQFITFEKMVDAFDIKKRGWLLVTIIKGIVIFLFISYFEKYEVKTM